MCVCVCVCVFTAIYYSLKYQIITVSIPLTMCDKPRLVRAERGVRANRLRQERSAGAGHQERGGAPLHHRAQSRRGDHTEDSQGLSGGRQLRHHPHRHHQEHRPRPGQDQGGRSPRGESLHYSLSQYGQVHLSISLCWSTNTVWLEVSLWHCTSLEYISIHVCSERCILCTYSNSLFFVQVLFYCLFYLNSLVSFWQVCCCNK